jgi:Ca2+-binding RTX toxin-like protein
MPVFSGTASADRIVGGAEADKLYGLDGNDSLDGRDGDDWLVGGAGDDLMAGRLGNDFYDVDSAGDRVVEHAGEGIDRVRAWISYQLTANVENLTLAGTADLAGTGNSLANMIIGNTGNNVLTGGAGDDTLAGGEGQDIYNVDSAGDKVIEHAGEGRDRVNSSVSYTLSANVEELSLTGAGAINGTGNSLDNTIFGNSGDNVLDGGKGYDVLIGGDGNDTYKIFSLEYDGDKIIENNDGGIDVVICTLDYWKLGNNIENLIINGDLHSTGVGNNLDNIITGSKISDELEGGDGDDTIIGNGGQDRLFGEAGNDVIKASDGAIVVSGGDGNDNIYTGNGSVAVRGGAGDDIIVSGSTSALITGDDGNDIIVGSNGANQIWGGRGDDYLEGKAGADRFIFSGLEDGIDTIADFRSSEKDKLFFQGLLHGSFHYLGSADFTGSGNSEARFVNGQVLVDTDGDATANITINLTGITDASQLHASDFAFS